LVHHSLQAAPWRTADPNAAAERPKDR